MSALILHYLGEQAEARKRIESITRASVAADQTVTIKETTSRVRLAFAANCPDAELFRGLLGTLILRPT